MTITVANTANTSSFLYWMTRTNELADALTNKIVTVNSNTTTGNSTVNGVFTATTLAANTSLRGGNETTSAVLTIVSNVAISANTLTLGANVSVNSSVYFVGNGSTNAVVNSSTITISNVVSGISFVNTTALGVGSNVFVNSSAISIGGNVITANVIYNLPTTVNTQTSGTSAQIIDSFLMATYRAAEYLLIITDNGANAYQSSKLVVLSNGGDGLVTDFGVLISNSQLGTFSANANGSHIRLISTPSVANTQIKGKRTLIEI